MPMTACTDLHMAMISAIHDGYYIFINEVQHCLSERLRPISEEVNMVIEHFNMLGGSVKSQGGLILTCSHTTQSFTNVTELFGTRAVFRTRSATTQPIFFEDLKSVDLMRIFQYAGVQNPRAMVYFKTMFGGILDCYHSVFELNLLSDDVVNVNAVR